MLDALKVGKMHNIDYLRAGKNAAPDASSEV